jgi:hypothetical protein
MFATHWSWHAGTSAVNFNLFKTFYTSKAQNNEMFMKNGLLKIERYIQNNDPSVKAVGLGNQLLNRLSCRYENLLRIPGEHQGNPKLQSKEALLEYLKWARIDCFILPIWPNEEPEKSPEKLYQLYLAVFHGLQKNTNAFIIKDEKYVLLDISAVTGRKASENLK